MIHLLTASSIMVEVEIVQTVYFMYFKIVLQEKQSLVLISLFLSIITMA